MIVFYYFANIISRQLIMSVSIRINPAKKLNQRNPEIREPGRKIIKMIVMMINEAGFEHFTFKKLTLETYSPEGSVYRYLENKHMLLLYTIFWYRVWQEYQLRFKTRNIMSREERLKINLNVLSGSHKDDHNMVLNEAKVQQIVVSESTKGYLLKHVDAVKKEGLYREYKKLCKKNEETILEINPTYKCSHTLARTTMEASHDHVRFAIHFPSLTDDGINRNEFSQSEGYLEYLLFSAIQNNQICILE